jgi:hypothetical protein
VRWPLARNWKRPLIRLASAAATAGVFLAAGVPVSPRHAPGRLKLWLGALRRTFVEADALFLAVRELRGIDDVSRALARHGVLLSPAPA